MIGMRSIFFVLLSIFYLTMVTPAAVNGADDCTKAREWFEKGNLAKYNREKAISYYQKAIDLCPGYVEAYINLSKHHMLDRKFEKARLCIEKFPD